MRTDSNNFISIDCPVCGSVGFSVVAFRFDSGRIVRCSNCAHMYLNPTVTDEYLNAIYGGYHTSHDEDAYMARANKWFLDPAGPYQHVLDVIGKGTGFEGKRMIDVGCGAGWFAHECQKRGADIKGVDPSHNAAHLAKKYFNLDIIPKPLKRAIEEGDLVPGGFETAFIFETIEHMRKPAEFLKTLYDLLEPGGMLYISTPNFYLFDLIGRAAPDIKQCPEHINFFSPQSLKSCVELCGYRVLDVTTVNTFKYGDRKKQVFANIPVFRNLWRAVRHINFLYSIKNRIFNTLNKHRESADIRSMNGTTIICIVQRPLN